MAARVENDNVLCSGGLCVLWWETDITTSGELLGEGGSGGTTLGAPGWFRLAVAAVSIGREVSFLCVIFIVFIWF